MQTTVIRIFFTDIFLLTIRIKKIFLPGFQTLKTKASDFFYITENVSECNVNL